MAEINFPEGSTIPSVENVPFDMVTYHDTDGSQDHNTVVLIVYLPNQIAQTVEGKPRFTWIVGEDSKTLCISFEWPTLSQGAFEAILSAEALEATHPRRIAMKRSFQEVGKMPLDGKGNITIILPFLVFSDPRKVRHRVIDDDGNTFIIFTLSKFASDEITNDVNFNNLISFKK